MTDTRQNGGAAFDTLVINLDRDAGRLASVMASCAAVGIAAERLPALTPGTLPDRMRPWFYAPDGSAHGGMMPGEIGCYASHLLAMEQAIARGRPVLVLEDDADLSPLMARMDEMIAAAPADWGLLRLSCRSKRMSLRVGRGEGFDIVDYWLMANYAVGYAVTPEGARRFLEAFAIRTRPVDEDMRRVWLHGVPSYGVSPEPVRHTGKVSSIDPAQARERGGRLRMKAMGPMNGRDAWRWRLRRWGVSGVLAYYARQIGWSMRKRLGRRPMETELVMDHPTRRMRSDSRTGGRPKRA